MTSHQRLTLAAGLAAAPASPAVLAQPPVLFDLGGQFDQYFNQAPHDGAGVRKNGKGQPHTPGGAPAGHLNDVRLGCLHPVGWIPPPRARKNDSGWVDAPNSRNSDCQWQPVDCPVLPISAITWPGATY